MTTDYKPRRIARYLRADGSVSYVTTVRLEADQFNGLATYCLKSGLTQTEIIRRLVDALLAGKLTVDKS